MSQKQEIFIFATAATTSHQIPKLVQAVIEAGWTSYTITTPNLEMILPPQQIHDIPGNQPIFHYGQPPLDIFPFGTMLVAPCTFNTFNKLALGIADNLAMAMLADAIGTGCSTFIAPSMTYGLWNHPQVKESKERLQDWGCHIIQPQVQDNFAMAAIDDILTHLYKHFALTNKTS
ncbi:MAG: flavoprotein [Rhizonema sp. PD37]|nr:flavoprotein [Rhizonema sp. PD37]